MKRHGTRPARPGKKSAKQRGEFPQAVAARRSSPVHRNPNTAIRYTHQVGLPANEKLRKFADEIYGSIELPVVGRKK